jgi:hypothetical protein
MRVLRNNNAEDLADMLGLTKENDMADSMEQGAQQIQRERDAFKADVAKTQGSKK